MSYLTAIWVTVNVLTPQYTYNNQCYGIEVRHTTATKNPLAVIDSETPNIERRLGYLIFSSMRRCRSHPAPARDRV